MQLYMSHNVFHKDRAIRVTDIWNIQRGTEDSTESIISGKCWPIWFV
jgi:hypothetical protein